MTGEMQRRMARLALSGSNRIRFYEVLKMQIMSGRTLEQAMLNIREVYTRGGQRFHPFGVLAQDCLDSLSVNREGNLLPDVFRRWFSGEEAASLAVGMRAGSLLTALDSLIRLIKSLQSIRSVITGAALAPFGAILALSGILTLLSVQLVPQFVKIIPPEKARGALAITYGLADFVTTAGPWVLGMIIVFFLLALWSLPRWTGRIRQFFDHILPPWTMYKLMQSSVFLLNLSTLIGARMTFQDALKTLSDGGVPWLQERLIPAQHHFSNGADLGTALERAGHNFPSQEMILHLKALSAGEGAELAIANLADWWLGRTRAIAKGMLYLSLLISVVMVFGCLGIMASSMMALRDLVNM
ncbi:type II secretion system F family protein [Escherichia coli]|uniref:type II secretion system F family protein n=1 Tax=Escherichia coli TaxID=562 RepID=UPI00211368A8|nr:type II secretion system F family protein [Escherichia coli]MCQ6931409.1 type II secretion system F family protein [Escherichia coli]